MGKYYEESVRWEALFLFIFEDLEKVASLTDLGAEARERLHEDALMRRLA